MFKKASLSLLILLSTAVMAWAANPFPILPLKDYPVSAGEKGYLRISSLPNQGRKLSVRVKGRVVDMYLYGNHRYKLVDSISGIVQQTRRGQWALKQGTALVKAISQDTISGHRATSEFDLSEKHSSITLRLAPLDEERIQVKLYMKRDELLED